MTNVCIKCSSPDLAVRTWQKCELNCYWPAKCADCRPLKLRRVCQSCHSNQKRSERGARKKRNTPVSRERCPTLSTRPIATWLRPYLGTHDIEALARRCGVDPAGLSRILRGGLGEAAGYERTKLDTVDRILCGMDSPGALRELYPEIYQFTPEQMREAEEWAHAA